MPAFTILQNSVFFNNKFQESEILCLLHNLMACNMVNMYEIVQYLCDRNHITVAQMCREIGIRPSVISELKHGRTKHLSSSNIIRISNFFGVSSDVFNEGVVEETFPNGADIAAVAGYHYLEKKETPAEAGERQVTDDDIKFALFGTTDIDDDVYEDVKALARTAAEQAAKRKRKKEE